MPFRRRRRMASRAPIQSYKHVVDFEDADVIAGVQTFITLGNVVQSRTGATIANVVGEKVFRMHIDLDIVSTSGGVVGSYQIYLIKLREGQTAPAANSVGVSNLRNQIWFQKAGVFPTEDGGTVGISRWFKVPKIYQRMREGDIFGLVFVANASYTFTGQAIYKSFS